MHHPAVEGIALGTQPVVAALRVGEDARAAPERAVELGAGAGGLGTSAAGGGGGGGGVGVIKLYKATALPGIVSPPPS